MTGRSNSSFLQYLPLIIGVLVTIALYSYFSPWVATTGDSTSYLRLAEEIQHGQWHIDKWGRGPFTTAPLYPLVVALVEWIIPGFEIAGILVSIFASVVMVVIIFLIARDIQNERLAWLAVPIIIFHPSFLIYGSVPLTEALFTSFSMAALLLIYRAIIKRSTKLWFVSGLIAGAAWMTRDVGIIIPAFSIFWLIISLRGIKTPFRDGLRRIAYLLVGIMIIYIPFKIALFMDQKTLSTPVLKASVALNLLVPDLRDNMEREIYLGKLTPDGREVAFFEAMKNPPHMRDVLYNWKWVVKRFGLNVVEILEFFFYKIIGFFLMIFIMIGIFTWRVPGITNFLRINGSLIFFFSYVFLYLFFYIFAGAFTGAIGPDRYLFPLTPIIGIWAANGILEVAKFADRFRIEYLGKLIPIIFVAVIIISRAQDIKGLFQGSKGSSYIMNTYKKFGTDFRNFHSAKSGRDDIVIMARHPLIPFYANASWVFLPYGSYEQIVQYARDRDVNYLFMQEDIRTSRPQIAFLLDTKTVVPEMKSVFRIYNRNDPQKLNAVLYMLRK